MDIVWEVIAFAAKGLVVVVSFAAVAIIVAAVTRRGRSMRTTPHLEIERLNEYYEDVSDALRYEILGRRAFRRLVKARKRTDAGKESKPSVYVLDFSGDLFASAVKSLREEVNAILAVAGPADEVVVRLESPGGGVPHYGLAAAQFVRLRERKVKVTVCIDRIAASGGYMMACCADTIVAAPFAIIGSIGVVAQVPNLHRLLEKHDIDFEEMTAGEFKRTVSVFGAITDKGRAKFQEQLEDIHLSFKDFVKTHRPVVDIDGVSTGEYWLARRAVELKLVDQLGTSDDLLMARTKEANVFEVKFKPARSLRERFGMAAAETVDRSFVAIATRLMGLERP
jgi:serine protease SohB